MLKACASRINQPLSYIYNHLLYAGIFPDHLRIAVVNLLYSKGDKTSRTDHKPFSLLTIFSKILEKAMHSGLSQHVHTNNKLVTEQCGFRKGISTEDAAFRLTDHHHQVLLLLVEHRASLKSFQALRSPAIPLTSFHVFSVPLISSSVVLCYVLISLPLRLYP